MVATSATRHKLYDEPTSTTLTPREKRVLELLAEGYPNKVIASTLGISIRTVKNHNIHIYRKLGVYSRQEAALHYLRGPQPEPLDCRSETGITVGLVDSLITMCRVLALRDLSAPEVREALKDLKQDEDLRKVLNG
jgi:DNA-binding CsgD family transcriptional regulator